jgi:hypothetical protein
LEQESGSCAWFCIYWALSMYYILLYNEPKKYLNFVVTIYELCKNTIKTYFDNINTDEKLFACEDYPLILKLYKKCNNFKIANNEYLNNFNHTNYINIFKKIFSYDFGTTYTQTHIKTHNVDGKYKILHHILNIFINSNKSSTAIIYFLKSYCERNNGVTNVMNNFIKNIYLPKIPDSLKHCYEFLLNYNTRSIDKIPAYLATNYCLYRDTFELDIIALEFLIIRCIIFVYGEESNRQNVFEMLHNYEFMEIYSVVSRNHLNINYTLHPIITIPSNSFYSIKCSIHFTVDDPDMEFTREHLLFTNYIYLMEIINDNDEFKELYNYTEKHNIFYILRVFIITNSTRIYNDKTLYYKIIDKIIDIYTAMKNIIPSNYGEEFYNFYLSVMCGILCVEQLPVDTLNNYEKNLYKFLSFFKHNKNATKIDFENFKTTFMKGDIFKLLTFHNLNHLNYPNNPNIIAYDETNIESCYYFLVNYFCLKNYYLIINNNAKEIYLINYEIKIKIKYKRQQLKYICSEIYYNDNEIITDQIKKPFINVIPHETFHIIYTKDDLYNIVYFDNESIKSAISIFQPYNIYYSTKIQIEKNDWFPILTDTKEFINLCDIYGYTHQSSIYISSAKIKSPYVISERELNKITSYDNDKQKITLDTIIKNTDYNDYGELSYSNYEKIINTSKNIIMKTLIGDFQMIDNLNIKISNCTEINTNIIKEIKKTLDIEDKIDINLYEYMKTSKMNIIELILYNQFIISTKH